MPCVWVPWRLQADSLKEGMVLAASNRPREVFSVQRDTGAGFDAVGKPFARDGKLKLLSSSDSKFHHPTDKLLGRLRFIQACGSSPVAIHGDGLPFTREELAAESRVLRGKLERDKALERQKMIDARWKARNEVN
jgi:hypothetical protein